MSAHLRHVAAMRPAQTPPRTARANRASRRAEWPAGVCGSVAGVCSDIQSNLSAPGPQTSFQSPRNPNCQKKTCENPESAHNQPQTMVFTLKQGNPMNNLDAKRPPAVEFQGRKPLFRPLLVAALLVCLAPGCATRVFVPRPDLSAQ